MKAITIDDFTVSGGRVLGNEGDMERALTSLRNGDQGLTETCRLYGIAAAPQLTAFNLRTNWTADHVTPN